MIRRVLLALGIGAVLVVLGGAGAWALDLFVHQDQVLRNVRLDGRSIGGLDEPALREVVEEVAASQAATPFAVHSPNGVLAGTAAEFGLVLDVDATVAAALATGRGRQPLAAWANWGYAFFTDHDAPPVFAVDSGTTATAVESRPEALYRRPVEPSFDAADGRLEAQEGVNGLRVDPADVAAAIQADLAVGTVPRAVEVGWASIPTRFDTADLATALEEAERLAARPMRVLINGRTATVDSSVIRSWIRSTTSRGRLEPTFDEVRTRKALEIAFGHMTSIDVEPTFVIVDGRVEVKPGPPVMVCCAPGVSEVMIAAARNPTPDPVELPVRRNDRRAEADLIESYGIRELVGEFTTNHRCCESRVENIHRIADLLRGTIIGPGQRFSINETIGERTREEGFVEAGVIERGRFETDVGGGISQFATTMFNAAFFAGLDFLEYQSHSLYISRYPYGREATLGYPAPDLVVFNRTPHAMLLWTEYTDTSITVQLWSTPYFEVEQTGQAVTGAARCTRVETFRTRTDPDGVELEDSVFATYRPGEGLDCFGRQIPRR